MLRTASIASGSEIQILHCVQNDMQLMTKRKNYAKIFSAAVFITYLKATLGCVPAVMTMRTNIVT